MVQNSCTDCNLRSRPRSCSRDGSPTKRPAAGRTRRVSRVGTLGFDPSSVKDMDCVLFYLGQGELARDVQGFGKLARILPAGLRHLRATTAPAACNLGGLGDPVPGPAAFGDQGV